MTRSKRAAGGLLLLLGEAVRARECSTMAEERMRLVRTRCCASQLMRMHACSLGSAGKLAGHAVVLTLDRSPLDSVALLEVLALIGNVKGTHSIGLTTADAGTTAHAHRVCSVKQRHCVMRGEAGRMQQLCHLVPQ